MNGDLIPYFTILNAQDGQLKTVGDISLGVLSITGDIIWPEGTNVTPTDANANIPMTYCGGDLEADGTINEILPLLQIGFDVAYLMINYNPFLVANFNLYA